MESNIIIDVDDNSSNHSLQTVENVLVTDRNVNLSVEIVDSEEDFEDTSLQEIPVVMSRVVDEQIEEPETREIHDTDDDTVSLPPENLPEHFPDSSVDSKGCKREHEDDDLESCKKKKSDNGNEDDGNQCPICLDTWSISGEHRVCCLKCGHLFGHNCLKRWLDNHTMKTRSCPTCKRHVSKHDIRFLYVKKLVAIDTTELEVLKTQIIDANIENNNLRTEFITMNLQKDQKISALKQEIESLKTKYHLATLQQKGNSREINELQHLMVRSLEVSEKGGCRVLDYNPQSKILCVSAISPNPLFSGFGVRKISMQGYKPLAFIPSHVKAIRDLSFNNNYLLSVSLDTKAKITDMVNNQEVMSLSCEDPLWSCCWDANDSNIFYAGHARGCVSVYDIRNPGGHLTQLEISGDCSPVVSLACTEWQAGEAMPYGGLLCCKLNSCWAFEKKQQSVLTFENRPLGLEGPFMSLRYDRTTRHVLVSARPNQRNPYTRHTVCELSQTGPSAALLCNTVHTFTGAQTQGMLTRSCLLNIEDHVYAAAHHASDKNVSIWSIKTGNKAGSVPAHMPILDLCSVKFNNSSYLVTLNERKLNFYKFM